MTFDLPDSELLRLFALRHPPHVRCRSDEPCWRAADDREPPEPPHAPETQILAAAFEAEGSSSATFITPEAAEPSA